MSAAGGATDRDLSLFRTFATWPATLSPRMLALARRTADRRGLHQVELLEADASALPLDAGVADLFISFFDYGLQRLLDGIEQGLASG